MNRVDVIKDYPSVYEHLKNYEKELIARQDQGEHWTNLRSCDYNNQFLRPKMMFMNMTKEIIFSFDSEGKYFTNQKCFIVTGESIKYLTAFFNSKLFLYCFKDNFPELLGDVREVSKVYFEKIPVIKVAKKEQSLVEDLFDLILFFKQQQHNKKVSTDIIEQVIDGIICEFYFHESMTAAEISILKLVEQDLHKATNSQPFNHLSREEKETVATQLYQQWSHPDNEVYRRMNLFAERSSDILKPILESR
jgi:hypothetical protein